MNFSSLMASRFNSSNNKVQLGLSVYSYNHTILESINTSTTLSSFQQSTEEAQQLPG